MKGTLRRVLPVILAAALISTCTDTPGQNGLMYRAGDDLNSAAAANDSTRLTSA
ncbi:MULTISPECIES: hypothetical protein [Raoultella]|uniref:hypothetical protein n=1 Tax=Raoultella TaxID=160674 RepID=UPI0012D38C1B|nr:hypothetical protein [Raoultella terrigena]QIT28708.1 hypothetical protein HCK03_12530 [Raoultella terrigena]